jgi:LysR family transcriptional regulator for bpeEF and oprC
MNRLDAIKTLLRVLETSSFSVPARELGVGQPAVSKAIAQLEDELGLRLVGRTTRHVSATPAGQRLVDEVGPLVRALDDRIARLVRGERAPTGAVRVACAPGFGRACIVPILRTLRVDHPGIAIELSVSDRLADLVAENVDLAVRAGSLPDSTHVVRRIGATPLVTVGSAAYLARHGEPTEPAELHAHDCVMFFTRGVRRAWRFERPAATTWQPPRVVFCSSNADDIRAAVLADVGLAQVPAWLVAQDLATGAMKAVVRGHEPEPIPLFFVRPSHKRAPERVRVVEELLRRGLAREPLLHVDGA